ncbi:helix-turn-helix domain-containing protein [Thermofilum pendens]|uniref:Uncharacterized protein n=1 Tax=Thermofilum pendens (strain DSM 2475 / Hrk 5) TaxID=368408 RepID=A1RX78_THEPD|nr:hypothetical protein [Thermofilum pendens]ABL77808.1 hypothetical protein Tpen_0399 [Thermofilum pendens Hrk 5]
MSLSGVEKFLLSYVYYEYGGKLYFQSPGGDAESFLAEFIAEEFLPRKNPNFSRVVEGFASALRGLREKGYVELRGYELILTDSGKAVATQISQEEYRDLKKRFSKV